MSKEVFLVIVILLLFSVIACSKESKGNKLSGELDESPDAKLITKVQEYQGVPTIFINDEPGYYFGWTHWLKYPGWIEDGQKAGFKFYQPRFTTPFPSVSEWTTIFDDVLKEDPDAYFLPSIWIGTPSVWNLTNRDMDTVGGLVSFGSADWRMKAAESLGDFIRKLENSKYASRVLGYHITAGNTAEWFYMDTWGRRSTDQSSAQMQSYRTWLEARYENIESLNDAWGTDYDSFKAIYIPNVVDLAADHNPPFYHPAEERMKVDYWRFHSEIVADAIIHFCKVAKEATNNQKLVGVFYGYTWEFGSYAPMSGHLALKEVLDSPYIDFLVSPMSYGGRLPGGYSDCHGPISSVRLHDKLWIAESDQRTHLSSKPNNAPKIANTLDETIAVLKRDFMWALTNGYGIWWYDDAGEGWFKDAQILDLFSRMREIANASLKLPRQGNTEVAVFIDELSIGHQEVYASPLNELLNKYRRDLFGKLGTPFDEYLLSDLTHPDLPEYKVYIIVNGYLLDEAQIAFLHSRMEQGGTVLWLHAPGYIADATFSVENVKHVTGIDVVQPTEGYVSLVAFPSQFTSDTFGISSRYVLGALNQVNPGLVIVDDNVTVLGLDQSRTHAVIVAKSFGNGRSILSTVPMLEPNFPRKLLEWCGVHLYVDTQDVVYANECFLGIHTETVDGKRTVKLKEISDVYDLFGRKVVARGAKEFSMDMKGGSSYLFFVGDLETLKEAGLE